MLKILKFFGFEQIAQRKGKQEVPEKFVNNENQVSPHEPHLKGFEIYQLDIIIDYLKL
jgi:hypothetical protein